MGYLVGGDHLEPGKVFVLVRIVIHYRRQENLGAIGRGGILIHPADVFPHQFLGVQHINGRAGQGPAVEPHYPLDPIQFQAGGQGFQQSLGSVGFHLEKGDAAFRVFLQQADALLKPGIQLRKGDAAQHAVQAFQESRGRFRGYGQQALAQVQDMGLGTLGNLPQSLAAIGQKPGGVAQAHLGQPFPQFQKAAGLPLLNLLQGFGGHTQAAFHFPPVAIGQGPGHRQKGFPFPPHSRQHIPAQRQTFQGHIIGFVGKGFDQGGENFHIPERQAADEVGADLEKAGRQGAGFPGAFVKAAAQAGPAGNILRPQVGNDRRAGLEKRDGQGRGILGQVGAAARPLHKGGKGQGTGNRRPGPIVFHRRFPGADGLGGDGDPFLGPQGQFLGGKGRGHRVGGFPVSVQQGRRQFSQFRFYLVKGSVAQGDDPSLLATVVHKFEELLEDFRRGPENQMFLIGVGIDGSQFPRRRPPGFPADIGRVVQAGQRDFQHFGNFQGAGPERVGVGNSADKDPNPEPAAGNYIVQFPQDGYILGGDAHFLLGFPQSRIPKIPILRIPSAAGERDFPLVMFHLLRALVQQDAVRALLVIQYEQHGGRHQAVVISNDPFDPAVQPRFNAVQGSHCAPPLYSKMEDTTSSTLRCNSGSSVRVQTIATWQARRAGMPSVIRRPA